MTHRVIGHVTQASFAEECARLVYYYPMKLKIVALAISVEKLIVIAYRLKL